MGVITLPAFKELLITRSQGVEVQDFSGRVLEQLRPSTTEPALRLDHAFVGYDLGYNNRVQYFVQIIAKLVDRVNYLPSYASGSFADTEVASGHLSG